jgi:hypothetical protein
MSDEQVQRLAVDAQTHEVFACLPSLVAEVIELRKYRDDIMRDIKYGAQKMGEALAMAPNDYTPTHEVAAKMRDALREVYRISQHDDTKISTAGKLQRVVASVLGESPLGH